MKNKQSEIKAPYWDDEKSYIECIEEGSKIKYYGNYRINFCDFNFVLIQQSSGRYAFRGRITALDRKGDKLTKHNTKEDKDVDISAEINLNEVSKSIIMAKVAEKAVKLYKDNYDVLLFDMKKKVKPQTITPLEAAITNADKFVSIRHSGANADDRKRYTNRVIKNCGKLYNIPMCKFSKSKLAKSLKHAGIEDSKAITELFEFWDYCVLTRICSGKNPVEKPSKNRNGRRVRAHNKLQKCAELSAEQQDKFYSMLEDDINGLTVGVALLASNINAKIIEKLEWKDIKIFGPDYVVVKMLDLKRGGATHNLSRPILPRAAEILCDYYRKLIKEYSDEELKNMPVCSLKNNTKEPTNSKRIVDETTRVIMQVVNDTETIMAAKNEQPNVAAVRTVLKNTYKNNLSGICNLSEKSLIYKFLVAESFSKDVTLDHYAMLSSRPGWDLAYTMLAPLRKCKKCITRKDYIDAGVAYIYITPETNHEFAKTTTTIDLEANRWIKIKCPHGTVGTARARGYKEDGTVRRK